MDGTFAIICGSLGFPSLIFAFLVAMRYLSYRETLALAEKGLVRGQIRGDNKGTLRWGIAITAIGMALCLGLWPLGFLVGSPFPLGIGPWMLFGLLPLFFGLALVLIYYLTAREDKKDESVKREEPPAAS